MAEVEVEWKNENLHYTDKDGNVTNDTTTYDKEGGVVTFNPGKTTITQGGDVELKKDTEINVGNGQKVTYTSAGIGTGSITKTGEGELEMGLNVSSKTDNSYFGSLTVKEGKFTLYSPSSNGSASLGAEKENTEQDVHVIVAKDAELVVREGSEIRIPRAHNSNSPAPQIAAISTKLSSTEGMYDAKLKNVDMYKGGVSSYEEGQGSIDAAAFICQSTTEEHFKIKDVDIKANEASLTGKITFDHSTLTLTTMLMGIVDSEKDTVVLRNHSSIAYNQTASGYAFAQNVVVDETSSITSTTSLMLMGDTKLSVSSTENGGVASRTMEDGKILYTTNQLSGDMLYIGDASGSISTLEVFLTDTDLPTDLVGVEFDLIVANLDGSMLSGDINDYVSLKIGHYDDTEWKDVVGNITAVYDESTHNTKFSFKVERVVDVPEPATATLSLLALAGLCARRRRTAC